MILIRILSFYNKLLFIFIIFLLFYRNILLILNKETAVQEVAC
ncbi:hypothetical protein B4168_0378 [Anoxybacillus flavithermus]|nr:hypothetical protein B4168_0378 [Anoxybacillus flavithermus]OAO87323.1 hypothetical protein GT23_1291 [Parageobacillus thermoglucosidasius]